MPRIVLKFFTKLALGLAFIGLATAFSPIAEVAHADNPPPPPPPRTNPAPAPAQTPLPAEVDPNAPGLSRAERIRRQEAFIRGRMQQQNQQKEEEKKRALEQKEKEEKPGAERPNNPPKGPPVNLAQPPGTQPIPTKPTTEPEHPKLYITGEKTAKGKPLDKDPFGFKRVSIFLSPATVSVATGKNFSTECKLMSLDKVQVTRIELVIKYPPEFIEPVSIHEDRIAPLLDGSADWGIDRDRGELHYNARFQHPLEAIEVSLLEIVWNALAPAEDIEIALGSGNRLSKVYQGENVLSENEFGPSGALEGAGIRIAAPAGKVPSGERKVERPIEDFSPALAPLGKIELRPPVLWLDYERRDEYKPGQWIVINFELENPEGAAFDELRFALRYDPDTLEFQDTDQRNWIRTGINLLDGPFRETWDWDTHIKNEIQPKSGLIDYRMGRKALRHFPSGTVARGIARVKKPAHEPLFEWVLNPGEEKLKPTTGVYLLGENLIERYAKEFTIEAESAAAHAPGLPEKADPAIYR